MKPRYRLSRDAIELIKAYEGFRERAAKLEDGRWTIGYGHTKTARQGASIGLKDAEALLLYDLLSAAHAVNELIYTPLTQNQFDALVAFSFSIGVDNFSTSAVLRRVNEGQMLQAAYAIELWRKAKVGGEIIVVDALVRRRAAEKALFLTPHNGVAPAPSPVLRPELDYALITAAPKDEPVAVETSLDGEAAVAARTDAAPAQPLPPSATEAAAAALGSRLENLMPDEVAPEAAAEVSIAPEPQPEPEAAAIAVEQPPEPGLKPEPEPELVIESETAPDDLPEPTPEPRPEPEPEPAPVESAEDISEDTAEPPAEPEPEPPVDDNTPQDQGFSLTAPEEAAPAEAVEAETAEPEPAEDPATPQPQLFLSEEAPGEQRALAAARDEGLVLFDDSTTSGFKLSTADKASTALLLIGLLLFGAGMVWGLTAAPQNGSRLAPTAIGWLIGLAGVGMTCVGLYRLLKKLDDE